MPEDERLWLRTIPLLNSEEGREIAHVTCDENGLSLEDIFALLNAEIGHSRGGYRGRLFEVFDEVLRVETGNVD